MSTDPGNGPEPGADDPGSEQSPEQETTKDDVQAQSEESFPASDPPSY